MNGISLNFNTPFSDGISKIRFAPKSNNLLVSSWDSSLRLYDVENSVTRLEISCGESLLGCCFQDEENAFSIGSDFGVRRHNFDLGTVSTLGFHDDLATCIEYSEGTRQLITGCLDKKLCSWDFRSSNGIESCRNVDGEVESISIYGVQLLVAVATSVSIYDLRNLEEPVQRKERCMDYPIKSVCSFPDGKGFAVGSVDGRVALELLDPSAANEMSYVFQCLPKSKEGKRYLVSVNDIVFHPSLYGAFVTGDNHGYASMWDAHSKRRLYRFPRYNNSVASLSYNYGGEFLAVASSYTYQEANEKEEPPRVYVHRMDDLDVCPSSTRRSK
ncbi:hypothetical protein ACHQM5_008966 [Ranunculus cassubicifolius]